MSSYEDLLVDMGQFGRWQAVCVVVLWIPPLFAGVHNLLFVFTGHIWQGRAWSLVKIQYCQPPNLLSPSQNSYNSILPPKTYLFIRWGFLLDPLWTQQKYNQ